MSILLESTLARIKNAKRQGFVIVLAFAVCLLLFFAMFSRKITYARFGLTVYGLIPVPVLDITVNANEVLGFRDKTHMITLDEVKPLLQRGVEIIIIGTGWHDEAKVEQAIRNLTGYEI